MAELATGAFEVKIAPAETSIIGQEAALGRVTIDKVFSGQLEGASKGEMLTGGTEATGAMAYVAIERVTGSLGGRSGSFLLTHKARMMKADPTSGVMDITVVPGSGTGDLASLSGRMTIRIEGGKHAHALEYELSQEK